MKCTEVKRSFAINAFFQAIVTAASVISDRYVTMINDSFLPANNKPDEGGKCVVQAGRGHGTHNTRANDFCCRTFQYRKVIFPTRKSVRTIIVNNNLRYLHINSHLLLNPCPTVANTDLLSRRGDIMGSSVAKRLLINALCVPWHRSAATRHFPSSSGWVWTANTRSLYWHNCRCLWYCWLLPLSTPKNQTLIFTFQISPSLPSSKP